MNQDFDDAAARELKAELRRLADTILDLEARGRLLSDAPGLLKLLGDARSRVFAWEVRLARPRPGPRSPTLPAAPGLAGRVVEEATQREQEAEQEWLKPWESSGEGEL